MPKSEEMGNYQSRHWAGGAGGQLVPGVQVQAGPVLGQPALLPPVPGPIVPVPPPPVLPQLLLPIAAPGIS